MTINEWKQDFKSFINELQMPRDDYNGIMAYIDEGAELLKEQETIVRCKDCKYWKNKHKEYDVHPWLPCMEINTSGNWFCAYGERR